MMIAGKYGVKHILQTTFLFQEMRKCCSISHVPFNAVLQIEISSSPNWVP